MLDDEEGAHFVEHEPGKGKRATAKVWLAVFWYTEGMTPPAQWNWLQEASTYVVCQLERAPKTQKLHFQTGFVTKKKQHWETVRRVIIDNLHTDKFFLKRVSDKARDGTKNGYYYAMIYNKKEKTRVDGPWEWGEMPFHLNAGHGQGERTDIERAFDFAHANPFATPLQWKEAGLAKEFIKYGRLTLVSTAAAATIKLPAPELHWFWGDTGNGKSLRATLLVEALEELHGWRTYEKDSSDPLWPGYNGQEIVLWDEFEETTTFTLAKLLRLWDRGLARPQHAKYTTTALIARVHIVTTPNKPEESFPSSGSRHGKINQLLRRLEKPDGTHRIYECKTKTVPKNPDPIQDSQADALIELINEDYPLQ